jgi:hypothetical protein
MKRQLKDIWKKVQAYPATSLSEKKNLKEWDETTKPQYVCMQFHIFGAF